MTIIGGISNVKTAYAITSCKIMIDLIYYCKFKNIFEANVLDTFDICKKHVNTFS